jgi:transketolase
MNTGALGHGLPICLGMALASKMDADTFRVFTLLGDGELAEGSNWEAAMAASHHRLDNLVAILDHNTLQITGPPAT